jgi:hypothetical protein
VILAEARRLYAMISEAFGQLADDPEIAGRRNPDRRPADAVPVEFVLLGHPVLDSPLLPGSDGADADGSAAGMNPGTGPEPPEMSDPRDTMGRAG